MTVPEERDPGASHLDWILRFQFILLPAGVLAWGLRSRWAAAAFLAGAAGSLAFWGLHRFLVARMLTPSLRRRWFYGLLTLGKLALIALLVRGMMEVLPDEGLPLATGILLFVAGILLEAIRLGFRASEAPPSDGP
ncbi:MAG: hypothetical protein HY823_07125 [Acidobacteria bacterium]|nr:hypothetical protein [Acidobacteriota bacterium]